MSKKPFLKLKPKEEPREVGGPDEIDEPPDDVFWYLAPVIMCQCYDLIELPYWSLPQTDEMGVRLLRGEDPPELPTEEWSATFGCCQCGQITTFYDWDVTIRPIPKWTEGTYQSGKGVYFAQFPCGDKRCTTLASMYLDIGGQSAAEGVEVLRSGVFWRAALPCGHEWKAIPAKYYKLEPVMSRMW